MENNNLRLETIYNLLGLNFFVPDYQRGYRWDRKQVKNLLDDIWNFKTDCKGVDFYCLQPIVIKETSQETKQKHELNEDEIWYEVIDGQQRLTTIRIILSFLVKEHLRRPLVDAYSKNEFVLKYETRKGIHQFLDDIQPSSENIDYFHISEAYDEVKTWFSSVLSNNYNDINDFLKVFLAKEDINNPVKVIWYEISEAIDQVDVFTRLNIGKIPLTNSELIRALFLNSNNFQSKDVELKQIQIATEWDRIEQTLQNDSFWYFIYSGKKKYSTRIEYIFDLKMNKLDENEYFYTFYKFIEEFKSKRLTNGEPDIDSIWLEVKKYFLKFDEWYNDNELYHLIGYLIYNKHINEQLNDPGVMKIIELSHSDSKRKFKKDLRKEIKKQVDCDIEELEYNDPLVKKILLLFNIETLIQSKSTARFPFDILLKQKWDIEHIRSQNDRTITKEERKSWAKDLLEYFTEKTDIVEQKAFINSVSENDHLQKLMEIFEATEINENDFAEIYLEISKIFKEEDKEFQNKDSISNLALLDAKTNRSYGNAFFPIKRNIIIGKDMNGIFVPLCTKNVFMKSYSSRSIIDNQSWTQSDADDYLNAIKKTVSVYLKSKNV